MTNQEQESILRRINSLEHVLHKVRQKLGEADMELQKFQGAIANDAFRRKIEESTVPSAAQVSNVLLAQTILRDKKVVKTTGIRKRK